MADYIADGTYEIEVTLTGGSGRAAITSPTRLTVTDGKMQAEIEWSSSNYDYMKVGEQEYYPVQTEGNSLFEIEVSALDEDIPITAETVAMSEPHMIDYTLHFDSDTMSNTGSSVGMILQWSGLGLIAIGVAACLIGILRKKKPHEKNA